MEEVGVWNGSREVGLGVEEVDVWSGDLLQCG